MNHSEMNEQQKVRMAYYTVHEATRPDGSQLFIAAPAGYARRSDGTIYRDGTDPRKSAPELTRDSLAAYRFPTYNAARRQASKLGAWVINQH